MMPAVALLILSLTILIGSIDWIHLTPLLIIKQAMKIPDMALPTCQAGFFHSSGSLPGSSGGAGWIELLAPGLTAIVLSCEIWLT